MTPRPIDDSILRIIEGAGVINGRYDGVRRLGSAATAGHFSLLFEATDTTTGQQVALKFFHPSITDVYRRGCFSREAKVLEELRGHPNVLQLVEGESVLNVTMTSPAGISLPLPLSYFAAELAQSSLTDYIYSGSTDPLDSVLLFTGICKGVRRIHNRRIVHRDLKPGNCLLFPGRSLKLSDFGTAKHCDRAPLAPHYENPVGDLRYTAPELLCGLEPRPELLFVADLFSLGAILFEMFTQTLLYPSLLTASTQNVLASIRMLDQTKRQAAFETAIPQIVGNWNPPSLRKVPTCTAPACVVDRIDVLYKRLIDPDMTRRSRVAFDDIFRQLEICTRVLRNQAKYLSWRAAKRARAGTA